MELDDLKQAWQDQKLDVSEAPDVQNIIDMLQNKNYGPIASLREKFSKSFIYAAITWVCLFLCFTKITQISGNPGVLYYCLVPVTISFLIDSIFQYKITRALTDLRDIKNPIMHEIQSKILRISKLLNWLIWIKIIFLSFYLIGIEIEFHFHPTSVLKSLGPWFNFSNIFRILGYIVLIVFSILMGKRSYKKRYGKQIDYLKSLVNQLQ